MARETVAQAVARRARERRVVEDQERAARNPAALAGSAHLGSGGRQPSGRQAFGGALRDIGGQASAATRGAVDALTLGNLDTLAAGLQTLSEPGGVATWRRRYQGHLAHEAAQDGYDMAHYGAARAAGEIGGTGLGLVALGPADAALAGGARIAEATPIVARELAVLGGAGAGGGVASQALTDLQRRRLGSVADYAGSAIGGAAGALASTRGRPTQAAALAGATTSLAQDVLNGRPVSWRDAGHAALGGAYLAAPLGYVGRAYSNGLGIKQKGDLGEALGRLRTRANGDTPLPGKSRLYVGDEGKYTIPDHKTLRGLSTEAKFGPSAELSPNQRIAFQTRGNQYRVDAFLPRDVGAAVAYPFALLGSREALASPVQERSASATAPSGRSPAGRPARDGRVHTARRP